MNVHISKKGCSKSGMQENPNVQIGEREKCDNLFPMQKNVSFIPFVHNVNIYLWCDCVNKCV